MVRVSTVQHAPPLNGTADFDAFYRSQRAPLYRALALTLRDADLAAEAVDEAMVRAYQSWWRISGYDNSAGWTYRVALNWAISRIRRRRRELHASTRDDEAVSDVTHDTDVDAAIASLTPKLRAVIVLRYYLDWSISDIAGALRLPSGTVKSRLHRGLAAMRTALEERP